jgi:hypothetical protein
MDSLESRFRFFVIAITLISVFGALGFMFVEGLSFGDAVYFSVVTVSTVGYGDVHPITQLGKLLATVLIIGGTLSFLGMIAAATDMLLNRREKRMRMEKINMILGAFFSDVGSELLTYLSNTDPNLDGIRDKFNVTGVWTDEEFSSLDKNLREFKYEIDIKKIDLKSMKSFLILKKDFLLRLLENPVILEHESFSDILRGVFHLYDEFMTRKSFKNLPESDLYHLGVDTRKVYALLAMEWLHYMRYLKGKYPYLFLFAMKKNPFSEEASSITLSNIK